MFAPGVQQCRSLSQPSLRIELRESFVKLELQYAVSVYRSDRLPGRDALSHTDAYRLQVAVYRNVLPVAYHYALDTHNGENLAHFTVEYSAHAGSSTAFYVYSLAVESDVVQSLHVILSEMRYYAS